MAEEEKPKARFKEVPKDTKVLPDRPYNIASLIERYGEAGGDEMYCRVAEQGGHFNARADRSFRPDLA